MITPCLSAFYGVFGSRTKYQALRWYTDNTGHQAAWMKVAGASAFEFENHGQPPGETWVTHELLCECTFKPDVSWHWVNGLLIQKDSRKLANCPARLLAMAQRRNELNREYRELLANQGDSLLYHLREIILDLHGQVAAGEFVGESSGALERCSPEPFGIGFATLADILGVDAADEADGQKAVLKPRLRKLCEQGIVRIEDGRVLPPTPPAAPSA